MEWTFECISSIVETGLPANQSLQPTLDRSVVSLPLHSLAVKLG